jgi:small subunit ribosomal protein S20
MANHKQTAKRAKQALKRNARNRALTSKTKTYIKKLMAAVEAKDLELATKLLPLTVKQLMQAQAKGLFHKNTMSHKVSQMQKAVNSIQK